MMTGRGPVHDDAPGPTPAVSREPRRSALSYGLSMEGADPRAKRSIATVVEVLSQSGPLSRADIQDRTGLSLGTIASVMAALKREGRVSEVAGTDPGRRGRPATRYQLADPSGAVLGLLAGHDAVEVAVMSASLRLLTRSRVVVPARESAEVVMDLIADMCCRVLAEVGLTFDDVQEAAIAVPAPVDPGTGEVPDGVTVVSRWRGTNPAQLLADRIGRSVTAVNDANAAALEECRTGAGVGARDMLYIECSRGLGGAVVIDGRIHPGAEGQVGEFGHVRVPMATDVCVCGQRGCLESEVSTVAMVGKLRAVLGDGVSTINFADTLRASRGNTAVERLLYEAGVSLGYVLSAMCNLLAPERLVLGGELAIGGESLRSGVVDSIQRYALATAAQRVDIRLSSFGTAGPALGAATLAVQQIHAIAPSRIGFRVAVAGGAPQHAATA